MSHTMSDRLPAVAAALEGLVNEHGILIIASALRQLGWEGRDLDQVVEDSIMEEMRQDESFTPKEVHEYNGEMRTENEIRTLEAADDMNEVIDDLILPPKKEPKPLGDCIDLNSPSLSMTTPPEWHGWNATYNGMYFDDEDHTFDAEGNLIVSITTTGKDK